ncbi:hypothetical protein MTQ10_17245 [Streptomyces sp. XM83C]|jgi:hypothetical protein|uniref:Lipoprotein n=1 Tax=Streptomyces thermocoprophilus TaxID=78356 RepID=A0ABV5VK97_9ACTN|nr:hypothetical protein [Streptomyces sp. XM83C]MCK1821318.1 hypothetical protein [Streptomyces sp. XM83C]
MRIKTLLANGAALLLAAPVLAGCSSDEPKREFTVPKALCGVAVPTDALDRVLPASGKKLSTEFEGPGGAELCTVSVDGQTVLDIAIEHIPADHMSPAGVLTDRLRGFGGESAEDGTIAYRPYAAASVVKCRAADVQKEDITLFVQVTKPGREEASAMRDFMSGYRSAYEKKKPCQKRYS